MILLKEYDEAGRLIATFAKSEGKVYGVREKDVKGYNGDEKEEIWSGILRMGMGVFLPAGYPHSVTEDYLQYKSYDALQNLTSTIAGLLANRAVLQGVGVGDATASPTGALLLSIFQDSAGRIATILFAHRLGSSIEPECKRYRLAADIFNDSAMIADCLSPIFPKPLRITVLCTASIMRALCGVAAGSSKATLTAHFARAGNLGELNAKDASQGNAISLFGMLLGSLVVSSITSPIATWTAVLLLVTAHLLLNYAAVRSVSMHSLNRQRAGILFSHLLARNEVLTPKAVAERERIFEHDGVLRWSNDHVIGLARVGVSFEDVARSLASPDHSFQSKTVLFAAAKLELLLEIFKNEDYLIWFDTRTTNALIAFKKGIEPDAQLKSWCHAMCIADKVQRLENKNVSLDAMLEIVATTLRKTTKLLTSHKHDITNAGWHLDVAALEIQSGVRLVT